VLDLIDWQRVLTILGLVCVVGLGFRGCRSCVRESGERHARREELDLQAARQAERKRWEQASAEREEKERQKKEIDRQRSALVAAELARPVDERIDEAQARLESASSPEDLARGACYADVLLGSLEGDLGGLKKARKRAAKKAVEERRQELSESRYLLCRDGTTSPSCECSGPRRGCCSHHGGVAGCEPKAEVELDCGSWSDDELVEEHLEAMRRPMPEPTDGRSPWPNALRVSR